MIEGIQREFRSARKSVQQKRKNKALRLSIREMLERKEMMDSASKKEMINDYQLDESPKL